MFASFRQLALAFSAVALLAAASLSYAVPIDGSLPLIGLNVQQNGADLSVSTLITVDDTVASGIGVGDYAPIPLLTSFGPHTLDLNDLVGSFSLTNAMYGTFTATSAMILLRENDFLDIFFLGTFTPGPGLAAILDPSPTSLRISLNQSGRSISEAITLNSPPIRVPTDPVPEPGTWVLMITGALGLLGYSWRRRRA